MATPVLTKHSKRPFFRIIIYFLIAIPLLMWVAWHLTPKRKLVLAIVDKTVLTREGQEHISLNWVLDQQRFAKTNNELYDRVEDYYGFFPLANEKYELKGLERFDSSKLAELSKDADAAYLTDTYGIFKNEWYRRGDAKDRSGIVYGGMSPQDLRFLQYIKERRKLIITEFNCLGSPTDTMVSKGFEKMFAMKWSGWIGRYFDSFDTTTNKELPHWLIANYRKQHGGRWPFTRNGIVFVHSDDRIVVLENKTHLESALPHIYATPAAMDQYGIAKKIKYSFWFDIIIPDERVNNVLANYYIDANREGQAELQRNGIPASFPAVLRHWGDDYKFFYFAGDFCDNPVELASAHFKKIGLLKWFMYNTSDPQERKSFFWEMYRPMVTTILEEYYSTLQR